MGGDHVVEIALADNGSGPPDHRRLESVPAVRSVRAEGGRFLLTVSEPHLALPGLLEALRSGGWDLASLTTRHASLEDVFVTLTGRHLRDE
jgi:ABC-2 type transport system ATP-binding protein